MDGRPPAKKYIAWADLIRVVAIFLVVVIHVSGQLTNVWGQIPTDQWMIANIYGSIARISVPLFFMMSGYLLLPRTESLRSFYTKRMPKVVLPFIFWSVIYLTVFCGGQPATCTPGFLWQYITLQRTYFHLWFLYSLISIYFILPVLRLMIRPETDRKVLWYLIGLWLIFQPGWAITSQFFHFEINMRSPIASGFLPYFVLGYLLGTIELSPSRTILSAATFLVGTAITIFGTYLMTASSGKFNGFFYDFVSIGVIMASAASMLLLRRLGETQRFMSPRMQSVTRSLATVSFGIYLIHVLIIGGLGILHVNTFMGYALWSAPLVSAAVFIISYIIVRLMQKIPVIRLTVPS